MKHFLILVVLILLIGCESMKSKPRTEYVYQEVLTPISNVPMPPNTECPRDAVLSITSTEAQKDSELVKAYRIAIMQLRDCSTLRQKVIDKYKQIAEEDKDRIKNFNGTKEFDGSGPRSLSGVVTADNANGTPKPQPIVNQMTAPEKERQKEINNAFSDLESEFDDLSKKGYDIK